MNNDYSGHRTYRENGVIRHEPLTPDEAKAIWKSAEERRRDRAEAMPDERSALVAMFEAFQRLKELGWSEAIYCPKDGTVFDAIEAGSTGIHDCHYIGEWPNGSWELIGDGDLWPSRPILWRPKQ